VHENTRRGCDTFHWTTRWEILTSGRDISNINVNNPTEDVTMTGNEPMTNPSAAAAPLITVAICTRNRAGLLQRAIASVLPQLTGEAEVLIVDNVSTDSTPEVAASFTAANPRVKVWREAEMGLSAARNAALKLAHGRYVLFLDDDATAEPGWLAAYLRFLSAPPSEKIAVVGGTVFPNFEITPPKWVNTDITFDLGNSPKILPHRDSPWGCNIAYRRELALELGQFDTRLGRKGEQMMSREESDLNLRLQDVGYEIWWLPGAAIRHLVPASRLKVRAMMRAWFSEGRSIAIQRLKSRRGIRDRCLYRAGRIVVAPFHALAHFLAMLLLLPLSRAKAIGHLFQTCRNCGMAWQLFVNASDGKIDAH
jgi:glycosyltransferase involved in cell wall biosynthesis